MIALVGFVVVWVAVTGLITVGANAIFPVAPGAQLSGVNWAAIPGSMVGTLAGIRTYRLISEERRRKTVE